MKVNELLEKGIPTRPVAPVVIPIEDLLLICKNSNIENDIKNARLKYYDLISEKIDYKLADFFALKSSEYVEIYTDRETLDTKFIMSHFSILERISVILRNQTIKYDYTIGNLKKIINKLKNTDAEDLKIEYPELYDCYNRYKIVISNFLLAKDNFKRIDYKNVTLRKQMYARMMDIDVRSIEDIININYNTYSYRNFIDDFIKILENFILKISQTDYSLYTVKLNFDINEKDKDKLAIYLTNEYQQTLKLVNEESQQDYLYFISTFYFENKELIDKNKKIYVPSLDQILYTKNMYEDYKKILIDNPNLKISDFNYQDFNGMNLDEVKEFMDEYLKTVNVNWEFFKDSSIDKELIKKIKEYYSKNEYNQVDLEKVINVFMEKKNFFDKSDPYVRLMGKNAFNGYIGYVYKNGVVVLEKFFEDFENGKLANNHAIYVMTLNEFCFLTALSKSQIIAGKLCKRFYHVGEWQKRVQAKIDENTSINVVSEFEKLNDESASRR